MRGGGRREWLRPGDWSGWFELDFDLPGGGSVRGLCQFLLLDLPDERGAGEMHLLRSPVRMHPAAPAWPISRPAALANDLATSAGLFAAGGEGWAAQALQDERMSDEAFLARLRDSMESRERRLRAMFDHGEWAFLLAAFDEVFWIERMMWRTGDPAHPRYSAAESESAAGAILDAYRRADSIAARTLERLRPGDRLIVFSPFGCAPFYRWINLNNALLQGGFLRRLDPGRPASEMRAFAGADWAASQAYALGAGQIYLNLQGREPGGSVPPGDQADALKREIADYLLGLVDPETGEKPVARVMDAAREFPGPKAEAGPDLLVAFRRGWRDDWLSPHGSLAEGVFGENRRRWSADYSMVEPETAPGLTLSSDPLERERLSPMDLAPAALEWFGVAKPEATRGRGF